MNVRWLLLVLLVSRPAPAEEPEQPQILRDALACYAAADFQGSITLLKRASTLLRDPTELAQVQLYLGINHEILGQPEPARQAFHAALLHDSTVDLDPRRFRTSAVALFRSVRDPMQGELVVTGGFTVWIDGQQTGRTPLGRRLMAGPHRVEIRGRDQAVLLTRSIVINAGATVRLAAPAPLAPSLAPSLAPPLAGAPATPARRAPATPARRAPVPRLWTWVAAGGALATLIIGIGLGAAARADHADWEQAWDLGLDRQRFEDLERSGRAKQLGANVMFGVAAGLTAAATILYFVEGRGADRPPHVHSKFAHPSPPVGHKRSAPHPSGAPPLRTRLRDGVGIGRAWSF